MTIDDWNDLADFLAHWYACEPEDLGGLGSEWTHLQSPGLKAFYSRFGMLAAQTNPFRADGSALGPLSVQDRFLPGPEVHRRAEHEVFVRESGGLYALAAGPGERAYIAFDSSQQDFEDTGIPLAECLTGLVLQETVLFAADDSVNAAAADAALAAHVQYLRTVDGEVPFLFAVTPDLIGMGHSGSLQSFAQRRDFYLR